MYMADFPILKWMQVDGRSVPFTYPQHQKGNGYVVTGEDNPLPTGNHVMTESGIWIPQRGTDEGAAHTQLTGSKVELVTDRNLIDIPVNSSVNYDLGDLDNITKLYIFTFQMASYSYTIEFRNMNKTGNDLGLWIEVFRGKSTNQLVTVKEIGGFRGRLRLTNIDDKPISMTLLVNGV